MTGHWLGRIFAAVCSVALMYIPSFAGAQERPSVEVISINREAGVARILVHSGGRVRDLNRLARRHATDPGLHVDIDMIAEWNPNRIIYVCFDNLRGERPMMSRNPATESNCIGYRSTRWLAAGETYLVPLQPSDAPAPVVVAPTVVTRVVHDPADRREIAALRAQVTALGDSLEDAEAELADVQAANSRLREEAARESDMTWFAVIAMLMAMIIALCITFYLLHKRWETRVMTQVRRLNRKWSLYGLRLRNKLGMLTRGINETSAQLAQTLTRLGRLRKRTNLLLVQLMKQRKMLHQTQRIIKSFQRQQSEETARRERLPNLLKSVDQARRHRINANNARARQDMVLDWIKLLRESVHTYPKIMRTTLRGAYRRMLADYRKDRLYHEEQALLLAEDRTQVMEDLFALTGVPMENIDPEVRLNRSIDAADKNAEIVEAQSNALDRLIATHIALQDDFSDRERAIIVREGQIAEAETDLVARMQAHVAEVATTRAELDEELAKIGQAALFIDSQKREHEARVAIWKKEHEVKKDLDAWSGAAAKALTESEVSALEGRVRGLELKTRETDEFLEEVRREFRRKSEILEAIERGPDYQAKLILQMTAYIHELEGKAGIVRKSVFGELPAVGYGDAKPKGKA